MNKIKVALIDDDPGWLKTMISFLNNEDDIIVVGSAMNKDDGINLAKTFEIDIFLVDIYLNKDKLDGLYVAVKILDVSKSRIIVLTCLREEEIVTASFLAGAVHFVSKEDYKDIPKIIRKIYSNSFSPMQILAKKMFNLKRKSSLKN